MNGQDGPSTPSGRRDPGWRPLLGYLPLLVFPHPHLLFRWARRRGDPYIVVVRGMVVASVAFDLVALALLSWLDLDGQGRTPRPGQGFWAAALVVFCSVTVAAAVCWSRRPMSCGRAQELRGAFARRQWLALALVNTGVLVGFLASFVLFALWPYLVGMLLGIVGMTLIAPTAGRLERMAEVLARGGCRGALQEVLF